MQRRPCLLLDGCSDGLRFPLSDVRCNARVKICLQYTNFIGLINCNISFKKGNFMKSLGKSLWAAMLFKFQWHIEKLMSDLILGPVFFWVWVKRFNFLTFRDVSWKNIKYFKGLKASKAAGIDKLLGKFLKDSSLVLTWPIFQLCDISNNFNSFLRSWKIAKVKPLLKKGSNTYPQNYRPFSLLPLL